MTFTTIDFHKLMRKAVVDLLTEYKNSSGINLSIYAGRPTTIHPPHAFCEVQPEDQNPAGISNRQRNIHSTWLIVWARFDSADQIAQRDDFLDGFSAYVLQNAHKAGGTTELHVGSIEDLPDFVPTWLPLQEQYVYFASRMTVEGFASG